LSDVWEVSPAAVTAGRPVGLLWASPDCKHFSKAKGGQPVKKRIRALAWVVVKWAREVAPDIIMLENVEEFATWGPLVQQVAAGVPVFDAHGAPVMVPCKARKGQTFRRWQRQMERLGYVGEFRERRAYMSGAGTIRRRLYYIFRREGAVVWPAATHGDPAKSPELTPWVTAADCIDWSLPCPSIFDSAEEIMARHGVRAIRPLRPKTMARVAKGAWRYVIDALEPFIVPVTHGGDFRANSSSEPLRTGTCAKRGEHAVVQPFIAGVGGRTGQGDVQMRAIDAPLQTATTKEDSIIVAPFVTKFRNGATGAPLTEPLATITAHQSDVHPGGSAPLGLVTPFLVRTAHGDVDARGHRRGRGELPATDPAPGVMGTGDAAVVAPFLVPRYGERPTQEPRALAADAPMPVVVPTGNGASLVAATMVRNLHGDTPEYPIDTPARTIMTGRHDMQVAAFLAQHNYQEPGHDARDPVSTIVGKGCTQGVVQAELRAFLMKYHRDGGQHADARAPLPTVDCNDRVGVIAALAATPPFGPQHWERARQVADFLRSHGYWDAREFVTIEIAGVTIVIVDIGMRMLTPRERFNAQGFPRDYKINIMIEKIVRGQIVLKPLSAEAQGRMVGNSVCPPEARALVAANCMHLAVRSPDERSDIRGGEDPAYRSAHAGYAAAAAAAAARA
jgi:DNA (cytosine-5)-methyltransferase 1